MNKNNENTKEEKNTLSETFPNIKSDKKEDTKEWKEKSSTEEKSPIH